MNKKKRTPKFLQAMIARRQGQISSITESVRGATQSDVRDEIKNICALAFRGESRVIGLNQLVFFSTRDGDAWVLDWEDELAIRLMKDGVRQPFKLEETDRRFEIQWQGRYHIAGELFGYIDSKNPTHGLMICGCPTDAIRLMIDRLRRGI